MRREQDSVTEVLYTSTLHRRPNVRRYVYVLICLVFVLVVSAQEAGAPAVLECFAVAVSAGVQLMQYVKPSTVQHNC